MLDRLTLLLMLESPNGKSKFYCKRQTAKATLLSKAKKFQSQLKYFTSTLLFLILSILSNKNLQKTRRYTRLIWRFSCHSISIGYSHQLNSQSFVQMRPEAFVDL